MRRFGRSSYWQAYGVALALAAALSACQEPAITRPTIDFATDPSILRGTWNGVGVSDRYGETAFSQSGELFAACTRQGLSVWDVSSEEKRFSVPCAQPLSLSFSPDSSLLVLRDPSTIRVLSAASGEVLASARSGTPYPMSLVFSPDGSLFASDENDTLRLWRLTRGDGGQVTLSPGEPLGASKPIYDVAFSPNGRYIVIVEGDDIGLWQLEDGRRLRQYANDDRAYSVAFGPDNSVYIGGETAIRRVSLNGELLAEYQGQFHAEPVVSPDGRYLVSSSGGYGSNLKVWDTATNKLLTTLEPEPASDPNYGYPYALAFAEEQLYLASGYGGITRYDLATGASEDVWRVEHFALTLELTATYTDEASYAVTGTFAFGEGAPLPVRGTVCVSGTLENRQISALQDPAPQTLTLQTSPTICTANLFVGDEQKPTWTLSGWAPSGSPLGSALSVSRGNETYRFWLTR